MPGPLGLFLWVFHITQEAVERESHYIVDGVQEGESKHCKAPSVQAQKSCKDSSVVSYWPKRVTGPAEAQTAEKDTSSPPEVEHMWTERGGTVSHQAFWKKQSIILTNFLRYHKSMSGDKTMINAKMWGRSRQGPPTRHSHQGSGYQCSKGSLAKKVQPNWRVTKTGERPQTQREGKRARRRSATGGMVQTCGLIIPGSCLLSALCKCCLYFVHQGPHMLTLVINLKRKGAGQGNCRVEEACVR